jgi:two-component system KDP operon response regulator KdpE
MNIESSTILIADDEAIVRRVLGDALAQAGHRIRLAASGEEALSSLEQAPVDLLLLDLQLGDLDGVEVMRQVRVRWPTLPIMILTAHGSLTSAIEAVRHDAADYLLKPIGVDELRSRVADAIARAQAGRQRQERIKTMYAQLHALAADEGLLAPQANSAPATPTESTSYCAGPLQIDLHRHTIHMHAQPIDVTPTEFAILHTLAQHNGAPVSCARLVAAFQHGDFAEDEARQIMRPHIVRLRRKIEPDPQHPCFIESVRGLGYRWNADGNTVSS